MESYYRCDLVTIVTCSSTLLCINCFYNFEVSVSVRLALYFTCYHIAHHQDRRSHSASDSAKLS